MAALAQAAAAVWPVVRDVVSVTAAVNVGCALAAALTRRALRLWHGDPVTGQDALAATSANPVQGRFHVLAPDSVSDSESDSDSDVEHAHTPTWVLAAAVEDGSSTSGPGSDSDSDVDSDGGDGGEDHDHDNHGDDTGTDGTDGTDSDTGDDGGADDETDSGQDEDEYEAEDENEEDEDDGNEVAIAEHLHYRRYEYYIAYESSGGRRGHMPVPLSVTRIQLGPHPDPCKDMTCSVCMENFATGEYLVVLQCTHILHANCFATMWLQRHRTCPMCRAAIPNVPPP